MFTAEEEVNSIDLSRVNLSKSGVLLWIYKCIRIILLHDLFISLHEFQTFPMTTTTENDVKIINEHLVVPVVYKVNFADSKLCSIFSKFLKKF